MYRYFFVSFSLFIIIDTAKILVVVPTPSISHQMVFHRLIKELLNRNQEVTVISADPVFTQGILPKNLKQIDLHDLSYNLWNKVYDVVAKNYQIDLLSIMTLTFRTLNEILQEQLKDKPVRRLITEKRVKFDLLILEECVSPAMLFSHIFDAPVVIMGSLGDNSRSINAIGAASHPLLYPTHFYQKLYNLTTWEKMSELYTHIAFEHMISNIHLDVNIMMQNLWGINTPSLNELKNNIQMLILYTHPIWWHGQPVPPNYVHAWGIHRIPEQILPKDLQDYLDLAKEGVIYVSFGTNFKTSSMHPKTLEILLKVFSRLPYKILWKCDHNELSGKFENIKISKWFPQHDVLRHPKVKLFITQGGLQSTDEAINAGVPVIGLPQFADQHYNTEKYVHFKIGMKLLLQSLTVETFEDAIMTVLNDPSYRNNIMHLRTLMQDQPTSPLENTIWWIEYVLRHGGATHLRSPAANMSWTEYYELELVLILLFIGVIGIGAIFCLKINLILRWLLRNIRNYKLQNRLRSD